MRFILAHLARAGTDPGDVGGRQDRGGPAPLPVQRGSPAWTAARGLLPMRAWLVPERGRLPAPHLYWDFAGESGPGRLGWNPRGMPRACESSARGAGCPPEEAV